LHKPGLCIDAFALPRLQLLASACRAVNITIEDCNADPEQELAPGVLGLQPILLHLSLTTLLAEGWRRAIFTPPEGDSSSNISCSSDSGSMVADDSSSSSSSSSGGGSSSSGSNHLSKVEQTGRLKQACRNQQQHGELARLSKQLWQQMGLSPDALPTFATALQCRPAERKNSKLLTTTAQCVINSLQEVTGLSTQPDNADAEVTVEFDELNRQVQQSLPRVTLQLPQLLLLLASQAEAESPDAAAAAVWAIQAAEMSVIIWAVPGLLTAATSTAAAGSSAAALASASPTPRQPAAAAARAGSQGSLSTLVPLGVLSALLDAWLGCMHNLLLQPSSGLLHAAASAKLQVLPDRRIMCPVVVGTFVPPEDMRGQTWTCFEASCSRVEAVSRLLEVLRVLAAISGPGTHSDNLMSSPV
jgi:hypothetical protein